MTAHERTGWRDMELSKRHRKWGFNCPAADLDFLMVEYNLGKPAALVEYKYYLARMPDIKHPTYRALFELSEIAELPFLIAFYWREIWAFRVIPINEIAKKHFAVNEDLTELEFVSRLYKIRSFVLNNSVRPLLKTVKPPQNNKSVRGLEEYDPMLACGAELGGVITDYSRKDHD